jgi:hypothetical protein
MLRIMVFQSPGWADVPSMLVMIMFWLEIVMFWLLTVCLVPFTMRDTNTLTMVAGLL